MLDVLCLQARPGSIPPLTAHSPVLQRGTFGACIEFTLLYPKFMWQAVLLSITSATGQMFIFYTLSTYGALVFAIIMT